MSFSEARKHVCWFVVAMVTVCLLAVGMSDSVMKTTTAHSKEAASAPTLATGWTEAAPQLVNYPVHFEHHRKHNNNNNNNNNNNGGGANNNNNNNNNNGGGTNNNNNNNNNINIRNTNTQVVNVH